MSDCTGDLARLLDSDLLSAGWDPNFIGPHRPSEFVHFAACEALRGSILKKYISYEESREKNPQREKDALTLFLQNNEDCRAMDVSPREASSPFDLQVEVAIGEVKSILDDFAHPDAGRGILLSLGAILAEADTGPGASIGCHNNDFYTKLFDSPLGATNQELLDYYQAYISAWPTWRDAEKSRQDRHGWQCVAGSKLFFAPKTRKIARVACTEPPLNMFFQKGEQAILERRLEQVFGIDLRGRPGLKPPQHLKNQVLARLGSVDGSYGTIDLSSASDRISLKVVEQIFPKSLTSWLKKTRSPMTRLPNGELRELYMVSSMGNAFTFPLETTIFASIVVAAYRVLGIKTEYPRGTALGNFAVFGDDIIVLREAYDLVCAILHRFGHRVNHDKSFNDGPFRESCGADFYAGTNIRGVYLKRLHNDDDYYKAINRLNIWSGRHWIPLTGTIQYLLSKCRRRLYVPMHEGDTAGIRTPLCLVRDKISSHGLAGVGRQGKFSGSLPSVRQLGVGACTIRYSCLAPRQDTVSLADAGSLKALQSKYSRLLESLLKNGGFGGRDHGRISSKLLPGRDLGLQSLGREGAGKTEYSRIPSLRKVALNVSRLRKVLKVSYNVDGVLLSAVASRLGDASLSLRDFSKRSVVRHRHSSCWDYVGAELASNSELAGDFHVACLLNLGEV